MKILLHCLTSESRVLVLRCGHLWGPKFYKSLRDTFSLKAKAIAPSGTPERAKAGGSLCPVPRGLKIQMHTISCSLRFTSLGPAPVFPSRGPRSLCSELWLFPDSSLSHYPVLPCPGHTWVPTGPFSRASSLHGNTSELLSHLQDQDLINNIPLWLVSACHEDSVSVFPQKVNSHQPQRGMEQMTKEIRLFKSRLVNSEFN